MTYQIKETREYYGPKTETRTLCDYFGEALVFADRDAAAAKVAELDAAPYTAAHAEAGRPSYKIVKA